MGFTENYWIFTFWLCLSLVGTCKPKNNKRFFNSPSLSVLNNKNTPGRWWWWGGGGGGGGASAFWMILEEFCFVF